MSVPRALREIVDDFAASAPQERLQLLLDYADSLPALPERYAGDPSRLERVHECQTPFFLAVEVGDDERVHLFFDAPPEAPTTRGYAGVLAAGLEGASVQEVLDTPADVFSAMKLAEVVSPLRMRGMGAILARIKGRLAVADA